MPYKIMPAESGWAFCSPVLEKSGEIKSLIKKPIVAWAVEELDGGDMPSEVSCFPVCPFELIGPTDDNYAVEMPDGRFEIPNDRLVDTEADAINALEECRKAEERFKVAMEAKNEK